MHALDPAGTRELVKRALEGGSKEVKVAAISCLGAETGDLQYLIEQAAAKAQDVRSAAYQALSTSRDPAAAAVLDKALAGKDMELATTAIWQNQSTNTTDLLVKHIRAGADELPKLTDKKLVTTTARRLVVLIRALPTTPHSAADELTLDLFYRRAQLAKAKGEAYSGADVVEAVSTRMASGPKAVQQVLARAHAELEADSLPLAFEAARQSLPPAEVFDRFAPYLAAGAKKNAKGADNAAREAIIRRLCGNYSAGYRLDERPAYDPRWLEVAVKLKHVDLVRAVGRSGHKDAEAFLSSEFDARFKKRKAESELAEVVTAMVHLQHPGAIDAHFAAYENIIGRANAYTDWYDHLIPELPKAAISRLESLTPRLKDREADRFLSALQRLREKND
jgi:hypothetical protein